MAIKTSTSLSTKILLNLPNGYSATDVWEDKIWNSLTNFAGSNIWTDGENIYYSSGASQYVLDKSTSTWVAKTWNGLTTIYGSNIWTDGENLYYSYGTSQYILNKATSTWTSKTWSGATDFYGNNSVWTDGENIYLSTSSSQYILNKSTSTWSTKTWKGTKPSSGQYIWTDGENIYFSNGTNQYVLNKSTSTWSTKTWKGALSYSSFYGNQIWTDGENIYYGQQFVLDKSTSTWSTKTWSGVTAIVMDGNFMWTDGENIYYSASGTNRVLRATVPSSDIKPVYKHIGGEWIKQEAYERVSGEWVKISSKEEVASGYMLTLQGSYPYEFKYSLDGGNTYTTVSSLPTTIENVSKIKFRTEAGDLHAFNVGTSDGAYDITSAMKVGGYGETDEVDLTANVTWYISAGPYSGGAD